MNRETPLKVLMLEDNPDDAVFVKRTLIKEGLPCDLQRVDTREEFIHELRSNTYDVILSDHSLPQFNSSEALRLCQLAGIKIPFILVTGTVSEEFAVIVLKQGADDYVLKTNLSRLPSAVRSALKQKQLEVERLETEAKLRKQNEELVKINSELDNFVYSVSHNLRAPLTSIMGLLNVAKLDSKPRDPSFDKYLEMMKESVGKLDETIKEILDYSQNSRNEPQLGMVDFDVVLEQSLAKLKYLQGFNDLKIQTRVKCTVPFNSDQYRITVAFCNLISNAIKYRDNQKDQSVLDISISTGEHLASITFTDNGIGISKELIPKVFTMFFRASVRSDGAGLGLYITKEIITKLKGSIEATSTLGKGSTFKITIPNHIT